MPPTRALAASDLIAVSQFVEQVRPFPNSPLRSRPPLWPKPVVAAGTTRRAPQTPAEGPEAVIGRRSRFHYLLAGRANGDPFDLLSS